MNNKYIIGVSGASGALYAGSLLRTLTLNTPGTSALIISDAALRVYREEIKSDIRSENAYLEHVLKEIPGNKRMHQFQIFSSNDIGGAPASGSAGYDGMVIVPCSMKTLSSIASGLASNLMERAADVCLKERKKLILVPRETPYSMIHLQNMMNLTRAGTVILPASPGYYHKPKTLDDLGNFLTSKILSQLGIAYNQSVKWDGDTETA